jgi:hypothetical protein
LPNGIGVDGDLLRHVTPPRRRQHAIDRYVFGKVEQRRR